MRTNKLDKKTFKKRRDKLGRLTQNSAVILTSTPEATRNHDVHHAYRADSNMMYLTGFEEPESTLIFRPGKNPETVLFVRKKDLQHETWEGFRYGPKGAMDQFGIDEAYTNDEWLARAPELLSEVDKVYYQQFVFEENDKKIADALSLAKTLAGRSGRGILPLEDAYQLLGEQRLIKTADEIETMKKSAKIAEDAHIAVMKAIKPGISERELHGLFIYKIMAAGAAREAYGGIFASGNNATTLHYTFNDDECKDNALFLIDAGAELDGYASDVTRTYPVNGKFNDVQKRLYQKLLTLQKNLIESVKPGGSMVELQDMATSRLVDIMLEETLLNGNKKQLIADQEYKKYYPHGIGHWLGLDVHDAGLYSINDTPRQFEPGMVFTIEPGIYIPANDESAPAEFRGVGIRIEDNILVTENGYENLTQDIPKEVDELERVLGTES